MQHSKRSQEGYLMIDHRASPGTPGVPEGVIGEWGFYTCSHCHASVIINSGRKRERERCPKCHQTICDPCHARMTILGDCLPMNKVLDDAVEQAYKDEQLSRGIILVGESNG